MRQRSRHYYGLVSYSDLPWQDIFEFNLNLAI
ncbi:hypothetical protein BPC006_II1896 [Burkholderia pseudomallei BPC006]|nr:hypothetical protein BPC006_II1896 [Burkholderia pseudomallei BPC006]